MRILYVGVNNEHPNEMDNNYIRALQEVCELDFFGPGFSTHKQLCDGVSKYVNGERFDAVILDFILIMHRSAYLDIREAYHWHRYCMTDYSIFDVIRYVDDIVSEAMDMRCPKLLWYRMDSYTMSARWYENIQSLLADNNVYLLWRGKEFNCDIEDADEIRIAVPDYNTRYIEMAEKYEKRIISLPIAAVSYTEFFNQPLENRMYDWTVPGSLSGAYPLRKPVFDLLKKSHFTMYENYYHREMAYRRDQCRNTNVEYKSEQDRMFDSQLKSSAPYLDVQISREAISMWRENYNVSLRRSRIAYADGGIARLLVRKYFEIPARGTVMACDNIPVLEKLGFKDGENMVAITPDNILEVSDELLHDLEKAQRIADNGRKLVYSKHKFQDRARCVIKAVDHINNNTFYGSYWENGDFCIVETPRDKVKAKQIDKNAEG